MTQRFVTFETLITLLAIENNNPNIHSYPSIKTKSDTGQHLKFFLSSSFFWFGFFLVFLFGFFLILFLVWFFPRLFICFLLVPILVWFWPFFCFFSLVIFNFVGLVFFFFLLVGFFSSSFFWFGLVWFTAKATFPALVWLFLFYLTGG